MDPEQYAATLDHIEAELGRVEDALRRLDDGSYDVCETCGGRIGDRRLAAHPLNRACCDDHEGTPE